MEKYLGVKLIEAEPATRYSGEGFINFVYPDNWELDPGIYEKYIKPATSQERGYKVVYPDGYVSWSPKEIFEEAYRRIENLTFGLAIEAAKKGHKIARKGWNGKGMFVVLMSELKLPPHSCQEPGAKVNDRTAKYIGEDTPLDSRPYFAMWTALGQWQPGWNASQADMLAEDWMIAE